MTAPASFTLVPHPATPCACVSGLAVMLNWADGWRLRYRLNGDIARLRLPQAASSPNAVDGLWRHICFEAFIGHADAADYREFNFSPSGDWAAYTFSAERVRDLAAPALQAPRIACTHDAGTLVLEAVLQDIGAGSVLGLCAVIETLEGQLSYWALHHPAPRPDFHQRAGWAARLTTPAASSKERL